MRTSTDAGAFAAAYRAARYVAFLPGGDCAVRVGERAALLEARIDADCFGFVTAWNPASRPRSDGENRNADAALAAEIDARGLRRWPMRASAADGGHAEPGWLLADIDAGELDRLARDFGQAGTLHWRRGEPVGLRMYFPKPPGKTCDSADWLE